MDRIFKCMDLVILLLFQASGLFTFRGYSVVREGLTVRDRKDKHRVAAA